MLLIVPMLLAAGCGGGSAIKPAAATSAETIVEMTDSAFVPSAVDVKVGEIVTFVDKDEIAHTATADGVFDSGTLRQGGRFAFKATRRGTFSYVCIFHPGMTGKVIVT
jgi:plastocyanin